MAHSQKIHFHIHWSLRDELDSEVFDSVREATISADDGAHRGEPYTIRRRRKSCCRCAEHDEAEREAFRLIEARARDARFGLLNAELDLTRSFISAALDTYNENSRLRIVSNGRQAYDVALKIAAEILPPSLASSKAIESELVRLKETLKWLDETTWIEAGS